MGEAVWQPPGTGGEGEDRGEGGACFICASCPGAEADKAVKFEARSLCVVLSVVPPAGSSQIRVAGADVLDFPPIRQGDGWPMYDGSVNPPGPPLYFLLAREVLDREAGPFGKLRFGFRGARWDLTLISILDPRRCCWQATTAARH